MMRITSTYPVRIKNHSRIFAETLQTYHRAVSFFMAIADAEWDRFAPLPTAKYQTAEMERIMHPTASHPDPQYNFDSIGAAFLKFPS